MLLYFLNVLDNTWPMAVALALIFTVFIGLREFDRGRGYRRMVWLGLLVGFLAALTLTILRRQTGWVVREFYDLGVLWPLTLALIGWVLAYPSPESRLTVSSPITLYLGAIQVALWTAMGLPNLFLYPLDFGVGLDSVFNIEYLAKVTGYSLGIILIVILAFGLASQAQATPKKLLRGFLLASFLVLLALVLLKTAQIMTVRGLLPRSKSLTRLVIFFLERENFFLYAEALIWGSLALIQMILSRLTKPLGGNPALIRKARYELNKRFSLGTLIVITLGAMLWSVTVLKAYHSRGPRIDEPLAATAVNGRIEMDLNVVGDGQLHRRSFVTLNGTVVRFIVIRKSDTAYGVGLDACDICGPTGYYQRGDQVICKLCDVVMNKVTIGFPGGCNPVPLDFKLEPGKLIVDVKNLEREKRRFE
ncbi:MAG: DUF2318 domain-containing protein [Deltaproteobacteria bacterium]|jgi:uncharacterized membrane protein|nr:DUF2318 domain-containing protein [Deltaproteobacteria bacterium]